MKKLLLIGAAITLPLTVVATDKVAGKAKYNSICVSCHGVDGKLGLSGAKNLNSKTAKYIYGKLSDYKAGKIKTPTAAIMTPMAGLLSDADMHNVATYISATMK